MISEYKHLVIPDKRNIYFWLTMAKLDELYDNTFECGKIEIIKFDYCNNLNSLN